jgi:hypothetical protein
MYRSLPFLLVFLSLLKITNGNRNRRLVPKINHLPTAVFGAVVDFLRMRQQRRQGFSALRQVQDRQEGRPEARIRAADPKLYFAGVDQPGAAAV